MQHDKIQILCTRTVSQELIERAIEAGIALEVVPFIETESIKSIEVQQEIEQALLQSATVVFTSGNAVEAVAAELEGLEPEWEIYCLGRSTMELVTRYFGFEKIAGFADSALELAESIKTTSDAYEVIFFCGDLRRPELQDNLHEKGIEVNEIVVYQTILLPQKLKKIYDGVLFFSPSAVNSFFELNKISDKSIFFAIGKTTASAIKRHTKNKVIVSDEPTKENVVEMAIEYFT
jgi:uroporphyrinogen-III synthase